MTSNRILCPNDHVIEDDGFDGCPTCEDLQNELEEDAMTTPETCDECKVTSVYEDGTVLLCPLHRSAGRLLEAAKYASDRQWTKDIKDRLDSAIKEAEGN